MAKRLSDSIDEGLHGKKSEDVTIVLDKATGGEKRKLTDLLTDLGISEEEIQPEIPVIINVVDNVEPVEVKTPTQRRRGKINVANALAELQITDDVVIEEPEPEPIEEPVEEKQEEKVDHEEEKVEEPEVAVEEEQSKDELEIPGFEKAEDSYEAELPKDYNEEALYDTEWIEEDDFQGKSLGCIDLNTGERSNYVIHNLNADLEYLIVKVLLQITDRQGRLVDEGPLLDKIAEFDGKQYGIGIKAIDRNRIRVVTGRDGVIWSASSDENSLDQRLVSEIDNESTKSHYKVIVYNLLAHKTVKPQAQLYAAPRGAPGPQGPKGDTGTGAGIQEDIIGVQIASNSPIKTGSKGFKKVAFNATIESWSIITNSNNAAATITFDIKKATISTYPTTTTIISNPTYRPSCSAAYSASSSDLTSWDTSLSEGDLVEFVVAAAAKYTFAALFISITSA